MSGRPSSPNAWLPYAAFIVTVAGIIFQGGQLSSDVKRNTERIARLEASDQARADAINSIDRRTVRIEAKLDLMIPATEPGGVFPGRRER